MTHTWWLFLCYFLWVTFSQCRQGDTFFYNDVTASFCVGSEKNDSLSVFLHVEGGDLCHTKFFSSCVCVRACQFFSVCYCGTWRHIGLVQSPILFTFNILSHTFLLCINEPSYRGLFSSCCWPLGRGGDRASSSGNSAHMWPEFPKFVRTEESSMHMGLTSAHSRCPCSSHVTPSSHTQREDEELNFGVASSFRCQREADTNTSKRRRKIGAVARIKREASLLIVSLGRGKQTRKKH